MSKTKRESRTSAAEVVVQSILSMLDKGVAPWKRDWSGFNIFPQSVDKREYRGVNLFLLSFGGILDGQTFGTPVYGTYKRIQALGGKVKKGEKGMPIVYWGFAQDKDAEGNPVLDKNGNPKRHCFLRRYTVFNVEQCEGLPDEIMNRGHGERYDTNIIEEAERVVREMPNPPRIRTCGHQPYYTPCVDEVVMPEINTFKTSEAYYATLFHELAHSTGSIARLNRTSDHRYGSEGYGKEELVAEMASAIVCAHLGMDNTIENSAAYCKSWADSIKMMPANAVVSAASAAQKAADYILGRVESAKDSQSDAEEIAKAS